MSRLTALSITAAAGFIVACGGSPAPEGPRVEGDPVGVVGAHEHGVARLALAVEGTEVFLRLDAPGNAVFGFEREPETDEEWALVAERVARLESDLASAVAFPADLECSASGPAVVEGAPEREMEHAGDEHEHSDVSAEVTLVCSMGPAGSEATLRMSQLLADLELVDLTVVTGAGQAAARVPGNASFSF